MTDVHGGDAIGREKSPYWIAHRAPSIMHRSCLHAPLSLPRCYRRAPTSLGSSVKVLLLTFCSHSRLQSNENLVPLTVFFTLIND